jgi:Cobalamin biosynthesis protein CobT (nicotinate-mononucleotide:5, 6-dimethylbenzimidazole phosphoribosyltransferase)
LAKINQLIGRNSKAKLREQEPIALGKQYAGSHVSRDVLDADSDDDPFAAHTDDDDEADDDDEDDQASSDGLENDASEDEASSSEDSQGIQSHDEQDSDDDVDSDEEQDGLDDMEDDDEESHTDLKKNRRDDRPDKLHIARPQKQDDREELRRLMASDQKTIAATISQAAKADAAKGKAVKEQRTTFDALLNTRIKLQKGLSAINDMSGVIGGIPARQKRSRRQSNRPKPRNCPLVYPRRATHCFADAHSKEVPKSASVPLR